MKVPRPLLAGVVVLISSPAFGQSFLGDDFQVNSSTVGGHRYPSVAVHPQGDFVVVWERLVVIPAVNLDVIGRQFAADGSPVGEDFQVNFSTTGNQEAPAVAVSSNGDFLVVWQSETSSVTDTSGDSIQAARFNADGSRFIFAIQVNSYTLGMQTIPAVAAVPDGSFIAVWQSEGSSGTDTHLTSVQGQRLHHNGGDLGSEFQVNTFTVGHQSVPSVAVDGSGRFVVVWQSAFSSGTDTSDFSIQGQRFASDGSRLGSEFQINTYTTSMQSLPTVAADTAGDFVVVWTSLNQDGDFTGVFGQRFASSGSPSGVEFQVNSLTTDHQAWPVVAVKPDGEFVVVWESDVSAGPDLTRSIQGQLFGADGVKAGAQFQVNSGITSHETRPSASIDTRGVVVVAWKTPDVTGRRFFAAGIFGDGFESGNTSAWSSAMP